MRCAYMEDARRWTQHNDAMEERFKEREELLEMRSVELTAAQEFLSTTDRLSEAEVLNIVGDLNENIYQVAVNLSEKWEKLEPPQTTGTTGIDPASRPPASILVQRVRNRDPRGLTFLLQSYLCSQTAEMTSGWGHHRELESVYQQLSVSSEHRMVCPRQRLTYISQRDTQSQQDGGR